MRTSFHHQPEAQHPKSSAIHKLPGRLPHLWEKADSILSAENRQFMTLSRLWVSLTLSLQAR
jgi:hypothetical protein